MSGVEAHAMVSLAVLIYIHRYPKLTDGCADKSGTVGIMSALETLLSVGFKPKRTIIFASGMDEEGSGTHNLPLQPSTHALIIQSHRFTNAGPRGAGHLAGVIEQRYGKNGIAMIVDEGNGYNTQYGVAMASPAVGEKGQGNIQIDVETPGGHSSVPRESCLRRRNGRTPWLIS